MNNIKNMSDSKKLTSSSHKKIFHNAFSLIELSIVVLIIGILIAGVTQGSRLVRQSKLKVAQNLTNSAAISSMPNLVLWLEPTLDNSITSATNGSNPEDGDAISSWNDSNTQLTSKINVTQATSLNQPTYMNNGINGLPSLKFDGVNSILYSMTAPISPGSDTYTMIAVWNSITLPDSMLMEQRPSGFPTFLRYGAFWLNNANLKFSGAANDTGTIATISAGKNYIDIMVINNNLSPNVNSYLNSNTPATGTSASPSTLNIGNYMFSVGGRTTSPITSYSNLANVMLSEIIIFDRALKKSEIIDVNSYLSKKYGILVQ
jgi:prepilin-type N-terminal cleavage/methylation domain-containing protein